LLNGFHFFIAYRKTFRPKVKIAKDSKLGDVQSTARYQYMSLGSGLVREAVKLPKGERLEEWLHVNGT